MTPVSEKKSTSGEDNHVEIRSPDPSTTRTGRDPIMLVLGVFLALFFIAAGYLALVHDAGHVGSQPRGPVKDPRTLSQPQLPGGETSGPHTQ
jgi:hypothetical protein